MCDRCGAEGITSEVAVPSPTVPGDVAGITMWFCELCQDETNASKDATTYRAGPIRH